jgi:hypothetical protein
LKGYVKEAMAELPYKYRMLPKLRNSDYVVFKMINPRKKIGVNIAFGLPSNERCSKPPRLPARHRKGFRPFTGAAAVPLICFADDSWRPADSKEAGAIRGKMAASIVEPLCEVVYDAERFEDFVCFD